MPERRHGGCDVFGLIVNSSRDILYASAGDDFADAAHGAASMLNARLASASTTRP
ncbi:hypothetical protein [Micromonospora sp. LOL_024]|uniref:hypothetical protein n=1 Tax=Micromonospora sp. LOL_024 TaxID=3345412 RepID=UPI003A8B92D8